MKHLFAFLCLLALVQPGCSSEESRHPTRLYVHTEPQGARIALDGKELGKSDGLFSVPPGAHKVTLELEGYVSEERDVDLPAERVTRVAVRLRAGSAATTTIADKPADKPPQDTNDIKVPPSDLKPLGQPIGTAFAVSTDGYLLTSCHIAMDSQNARVSIGGRTYHVRVVHFDEGRDLALIKIDATGLPVLPLGDSDTVVAGEDLHVFGYVTGSTLAGTFMNKSVSIAGAQTHAGKRTRLVWQVDKKESSGKLGDGGPLISQGGAVMGFVSAKLSPEASLSVALPINSVKALLKDRKVKFTVADAKAKLSRSDLFKRVAPAAAVVTATATDISRELVWETRGHISMVYTVAFSPDGKTLASTGGSTDGMIKLWDARSGKQKRSFTHTSRTRVCMAFSHDGKMIATATGYGDGTVKLWDTETGKLLHTLTEGSRGNNSGGVAFSPDGKLVVRGSAAADDMGARAWDTRTGKFVRMIATGEVRSLGFSPDGKTLACGQRHDGVGLWDVATGKRMRVLAPDSKWSGETASATFSPDGKTLAGSLEFHSKVHLWDVQSGKVVQTFKECTGSSPLVFSPGGRVLAMRISKPQLALGLADWRTHTRIRTLRGHSNGISLAISPDGRLMASGGIQGMVKVWDISQYTRSPAMEVPTATGNQAIPQDQRTGTGTRIDMD